MARGKRKTMKSSRKRGGAYRGATLEREIETTKKTVARLKMNVKYNTPFSFKTPIFSPRFKYQKAYSG